MGKQLWILFSLALFVGTELKKELKRTGRKVVLISSAESILRSNSLKLLLNSYPGVYQLV